MNEAMKCDRCGKMVDAVYPHTCTPLALRLADALQAGADDPMWADHCEMSKRTASLSAAELRRLHAEVEELRGALDEAMWHVKYKELKAVNESDTALLRQALEALEANHANWTEKTAAITALRERLGEKT